MPRHSRRTKRAGNREPSAAQKANRARFAAAAKCASAKVHDDPKLEFSTQMHKELTK